MVHVVGRGWPVGGVDALGQVGVVEQPVAGTVEQFVLLALAHRLDGEAELLLDLVHGVVEQIGDTGVDAQRGLTDLSAYSRGLGS